MWRNFLNLAAPANEASDIKTARNMASQQRRLEMTIKNLFNAFLDVHAQEHPFNVEERFLNLPWNDQQRILNVAISLMMAKPRMADFLMQRLSDDSYRKLPDCWGRSGKIEMRWSKWTGLRAEVKHGNIPGNLDSVDSHRGRNQLGARMAQLMDLAFIVFYFTVVGPKEYEDFLYTQWGKC